MNPVTGYTMTNFLRWLVAHHSEVEDLRSLPEEDLLQLVNEFEGGKLDRNDILKGKWRGGFHQLFKEEDDWKGYDRARYELKEIEGLTTKKILLDFEKGIQEKQIIQTRNENDPDIVLRNYLSSRKIIDIDRYIGNIKSLKEGKVYEDLTHQLVTMGVKPKVGRRSQDIDILARHRSVPLHAIFLYTSEEQEVGSYISENWGALDTLSGNVCDIHPSVDQFKNAEDAYDHISKLDVIKHSNFKSYSQLPGLFFWDNLGRTEYISFGLKPNLADIRIVVRAIFEEIHKEPSISSVTHAKKLLSKEGQLEAKKAEVKKHNVWSDLVAILLVFLVIVGFTSFVSQFISPFILSIVFITALLFFVLILIWLLRRTDELSETNFIKVVFRFFDALPLLRQGSNKEEDQNDKKPILKGPEEQ